METTNFLTLEAAARALNVQPARIEHHVFRGDLAPIFRMFDGTPVFIADDIRQLGRQIGRLPKED